MSRTDCFTISDAQFSPCRTWRYTLTRQWGDGVRSKPQSGGCV